MSKKQIAIGSSPNQNSINGPLKTPFMLVYSTGQVIEVLITGVVGIFLLFYLTAVCGLSPEAAGLVLFLSLAIDAVADPLIGATSDGLKSRWGRRHPLMIGGLFVLPFAIVGIFVIPVGIPAHWMFAYVLAFNILMRLSTSFFILPYAALMAEFSSDYEERSRMMIFRLIFAVIAMTIALALSFGVLFNKDDALSQASPYVTFALLIVALILAAGLPSTFGTLSAAKQLPRRTETRPPMTRFFQEIFQLFQNPSFVVLFFGALIFLTAVGFLNAINLHAFIYFWNLTPEQIQMPTVAQPVGMLISIPLSMWLTKTIEKRSIMIIVIASFSVAYSLPILLVDTGILATTGPFAIVVVVNCGLFAGAGAGLSFVAFGSMVADAVDEHDFLFNIRREGLYFAALIFGGKTATGLGGMMAGIGLKLINFPIDPDSVEGASQLTPQVVDSLGLLWGMGFSIFMALSAPFFVAYKLDRQAHRRIMDVIRARDTTNFQGRTDQI